jgi:hypothetical protein
MTKDNLLKLIAESGYNIGYGAKKHLATYDMVEKVPGWIGFISLVVGIYALLIPDLAQNTISAAFIAIGIASLFINFYTDSKDKYQVAGSALTDKFHELRILYQTVKSTNAGDDLTQYTEDLKRIQKEVFSLRINKQIFLSDWYAHYKFFWQSQTEWMNEQLKFSLLRDKWPLSFTIIVFLIVAGLIYKTTLLLISLIHFS